MGLLNLYDTISNRHSSVRANGKIKDILPGIDFSHSLVLKAGCRLDGDYEVQDEDVLYVRIVPASTAALAVVSIVVAVIATGVAVGSSIYANKKAEEARLEMEKAQRDAQNLAAQTTQLPFIRGSKNRKALGETVQFVLGSTYSTPYNLTDGFFSIGGSDGVSSYYNAVFSLGFNSQKVTDILLGNESICHRDEGISGETAFDSSSVYYHNNANRVEVRQPGQNISLSGCNQKVSSTYSGAELKHNFGENAIPIIVQAAENAMTIQVCIQFSALRQYDSDESEWKARSVQVHPYWSNDGGQTWNLFLFEGAQTKVVEEEVFYNVFEKNVNHTIRYVATKSFSAEESYGKQISIKVLKETPKAENNSQEDCCLLWYQTFSYDAQKSSSSSLIPCRPLEDELFLKTTRVAYRIQADESTQPIVDELHCYTQGKARVWNGSAWSDTKETTRNPAAWILEVLTSDVHAPSKIQDSQLLLSSFGSLYEYCYQNEYYCDGIIVKGERKKDILEKLLRLCNASLIINNEGLYEVCIDKEESTPVALLNAENIVSFSFSKSLAKKVDGSKVTFTNRESWTVDTFYSMLDGGAYDYVNDTVDSVAFDYVTEYSHAYKLAQREERQKQLQPREIKVDVGHEGDYYPLYSTVLIQLPHLLQGLRSSVIKGVRFNSDGNITQIEISDMVTCIAGQRYGVIIQATNQYGYKIYSAEVVNAESDGENTRLLSFTEPLAVSGENIIPEMGNHLSFGLLDENGRFSKITNVMKIYGVEPNGKDGFSLTLRDYNEEVYRFTPAGVPIPEYKSNITAPQKRSNTVTLDDLNRLKDQMNKAIEGLLIRPEEIGRPPIVSGLTALATENGITVNWDSIPSTGLQNSIKHYLIELSKDGGQTWTALSPVGTNQYIFNFVRSGEGAVGYPEADFFESWRFRVKAENIYGKESIDWLSTLIDTSQYGTWIPQQPIIATPRVSHRTVTLNFSQQRSCYGAVFYLVSIQRYDEYNTETWFKPDIESDPYAEALAYKDCRATEYVDIGGVRYYFLKSANSFTQTLPLEKQLLEEYFEVHRGSGTLERLKVNVSTGILDELIIRRNNSDKTESVDTNYYYRVWCLNATTGVVSAAFSQVMVTAKATSAYDIVDAAIITNKLADGAVTVDKLHANSVTAEKLYSRNLTTTGAFIGSIYGAALDTVEYYQATIWQSGVVYYVYDSASGSFVKPAVQPTAETFSQGVYFEKNKNYGMPKETANNYWKNLDSDNPEFRVGNNINDELFEIATGRTDTNAEYMHYVPQNTVYNYNTVDPQTGTDVSGSVTLAQGIYFKIANFVVTAINSIIRGVFYIKSKISGRHFVEANPENGVMENLPAETLRIHGDVAIGAKTNGVQGSLALGGGLSVGGGITSQGNITVGGGASAASITTQGAVTGGSFISNGGISAAGAISGNSLSTSGAISSQGNVSGVNVSASSNITASGTVSGALVTGTRMKLPSGRPATVEYGDMWVV